MKLDYDCGAVGGMEIAKKTEELRENQPQRHFVHHKSTSFYLG
jgi:hypothetical protein